ncbi:MAG: hypothetical protein COA79_20125 [Planctomycetota bacterium]|nr:MAG: hypothetical protein COA79_20125 [Planctomycetota bacterium]
MHCEKAEMLLSQITFDELDGHDKESLEIHLASCDNCTAIHQDIGATKNILENFLTPDEIPSLSEDRRQSLLSAFAELEEAENNDQNIIAIDTPVEKPKKKKYSTFTIVLANVAVLLIGVGICYPLMVGDTMNSLKSDPLNIGTKVLELDSYNAATGAYSPEYQTGADKVTIVTKSKMPQLEGEDVDEAVTSTSTKSRGYSRFGQSIFDKKDTQYAKTKNKNRGGVVFDSKGNSVPDSRFSKKKYNIDYADDSNFKSQGAVDPGYRKNKKNSKRKGANVSVSGNLSVHPAKPAAKYKEYELDDDATVVTLKDSVNTSDVPSFGRRSNKKKIVGRSRGRENSVADERIVAITDLNKAVKEKKSEVYSREESKSPAKRQNEQGARAMDYDDNSGVYIESTKKKRAVMRGGGRRLAESKSKREYKKSDAEKDNSLPNKGIPLADGVVSGEKLKSKKEIIKSERKEIADEVLLIEQRMTAVKNSNSTHNISRARDDLKKYALKNKEESYRYHTERDFSKSDDKKLGKSKSVKKPAGALDEVVELEEAEMEAEFAEGVSEKISDMPLIGKEVMGNIGGGGGFGNRKKGKYDSAEKKAREILRYAPKNLKAAKIIKKARKSRRNEPEKSQQKMLKNQIDIGNTVVDEYHIPHKDKVVYPAEWGTLIEGKKGKKLNQNGKEQKRTAPNSLTSSVANLGGVQVKPINPNAAANASTYSVTLSEDVDDSITAAPTMTETVLGLSIGNVRYTAKDVISGDAQKEGQQKVKREDLAKDRLQELAKKLSDIKSVRDEAQKFKKEKSLDKLGVKPSFRQTSSVRTQDKESGGKKSKYADGDVITIRSYFKQEIALEELEKSKSDEKSNQELMKADREDVSKMLNELEKKEKSKNNESGTINAGIRMLKNNTEQAFQIESLKEKLAKSNKNLEEKNWIIKQAEKTMGKSLTEILVDTAGVSSGPLKTISGKIVTSAPQENMAMISVGKADGVKVGHKFTIYRGSEYIGRVEVIELFPNMASTRVITKLKNDKGLKILNGDSIATHLGGGEIIKVVADDIVIEKPEITKLVEKPAKVMEAKLVEEVEEEIIEEMELPSAKSFPVVPVNPFVLTKQDKLATFSIDTDTASFRVCRNFIQSGYLPPIGAVRMEEFVNYFDYNYSGKSNQNFTIHSEMTPSPFGEGLVLLKVGIKGKVIGRNGRKPAHLTFVLDASGSMGKADRMPLVKQGIKLLLNELNPTDTISLVTYGAKSNVFIEKTLVSNKAKIITALNSIQTGGSTNMVDGIKAGYATAARYFKTENINRIILCSDGVANVGTVNATQILQEVSKYKEQGITFTSVGFGSGNYNDALLEKLSNSGDGSYLYVNTKRDLKDAFVTELSANLAMIGKDVKIQVAFDEERVYRYRLIGYENRAVADKDFRNDKVDAGEITSGKTVTALFELQLKAPKDKTFEALDFAKVFVRYKNPGEKKAKEISLRVKAYDLKNYTPENNPRLFMGACAAEFAEILRKSSHAKDGDLNHLESLLRRVSKQLPLDNKIKELINLVSRSKGLPRAK